MKTHKLKTIPEYFGHSWIGLKPFEIRKNDRDFERGDIVELHEYLPEENRYTGRIVYSCISYMTDFEQKEGYVVLGLIFLSKKQFPWQLGRPDD